MSAPVDNAVRWQAPDLNPRPTPVRQAPSVAELEAIERAASEEGFRRGHVEGHAQGLAEARAEMQRLAAELEALIAAFAQPLALVDAEVEAVLAELAVQVGGALAGRALAQEPALLAGLVTQALRMTLPTQRDVEVRLHPDDIVALTTLPEAEALPARLVADPALARGDLRVHTEAMRVDGSLHVRLLAAQAVLRDDAGGAP